VKIDRTTAGIRLRFPRGEGELLVQLFGDTAEALRPGALDADDPVARRLFPSAYGDDPQAEQAFRELTETTLRDERLERAEQCTADVASAPVRRRDLELTLDEDAVQRWMRAVNDVRLALGTRLGITEDDGHDLDPKDRDAGPRAAYLWLTAVQDGLVHAAMR
jgi:uncharacterized protein DUF2017